MWYSIQRFFKILAFHIKIWALKSQVLFFEYLYHFHIRTRYLHDKVYQRGGWYKRWTDKPVSYAVHRASIVAFVISFVVFQAVQNLWPYMFTFKPREVLAGQNSVTWTTQGDFESNASTTGTATTRSQLDTSTSSGDVTLTSTGVTGGIPLSVTKGNGADLALSVSSGTFDININTSNGRTYADGVNFSVTSNTPSGQNQVTLSSTPNGLQVNDEILIINLKGTSSNYANVGLYETKRITAINTNTLTLDANLSNIYDGTTQKIMVQRVPNYTDVTIASGASLTTSSWDGTKGGVLFFRANGTVTVNGNISMNETGFRGGAGTGYSGNAGGGESYNGTGGSGGGNGDGGPRNGSSGQGGGGGGGIYGSTKGSGAAGTIGSGGGGGGGSGYDCGADRGAGGAGGGYGGAGSGGAGGGSSGNGSGNTGGSGATSSVNYVAGGGGGGGNDGRADSSGLDSRAYMGGGGAGGGGACLGGSGGNGGNAGGIVFIGAGTINIASGKAISANGANGVNGGSQNFQGGGGGGAGAGGSIILRAGSLSNSGSITANGGLGGSANYSGGNGGGGRTFVRYYDSFTGTNPTPNYSGALELLPYYISGTIGGTTASNVGLRVDAGSGLRAKASQLNWTATTSASGQKVLFKVRSGDTQAGLDSSACYGPSSSEANPCSDWTTAGKFFSQINGQSNSSTTILNTIPAKRYIEILVRLESSGADTPTLSDVTLTYDNVEAPVLANTSISTSSNGTISSGGTEGVWTKDTTVNVTSTGLTCTNCGTSNQRKIEVEVKPVATAFDGTATGGFLVQGDYNDTTFASTAIISVLSVGTSYHSRLRTLDAQGRVSGWTSYGTGSDTPPAAADFGIDQTPSTVTSFELQDNSTSSASYVGSGRIVKAVGIYNDTGGSSGTLKVQFSQDGSNWGTYPGTGTTNTMDVGNSWASGTYKTVTADPNPQNITNVWYLEGTDGSKTVYVRTKDAVGNVSGTNFTSENDWNGTTQGAATTLSGLGLTAPSGDLKLGSEGSSINIGDGSDGNATISGNVNIINLYEDDVVTGVTTSRGVDKGLFKGTGTYNPSTSAVPNFNNLTITGTGILITSSLVKLELKTQGTLTIDTGGKIDVSGKGYAGGQANQSGQGPGGGTGGSGNGGGGGGYGGNGGDGLGGFAGGVAYGAYPTEPTFGSGGGSTWGGTSNWGHDGGGAIKIQTNQLNLNGQIISNGLVKNGYTSGQSGGGGSGGGIYILSPNSVTNAGNIFANGSTHGTDAGGGGGGRVLVQAPSVTGTPLVTGGAPGGYGGGGGSPGTFNAILPYNVSGTLGGTGTGLRVGSPTGAANKWSSLNWSASGLSSTYKIGIQVRPADTWGNGDTGYVNPLDGTSSYYYLTSGTSGTVPLSSSFANTKTLETRLIFEGDGGNTPTLGDLTVGYATSDSITLDTAPPAAFDLSSPANNTWQTSATPTLSWNASSDAYGVSKYQLYIDGSLDTDNISGASTSQTPTTPFNNQTTHTWYVKAIDNAGNITQSTSTFNIGYDATAPSLALDPGFTFSASDTNTNNVLVNWNTYADDSGSGAPVDYYNIERLKNSDYLLGSHTLTSNWALGGDGAGSGYYGGYGNKTVTSQTDNVGANPQDIEASVKYIYRIKVTDKAGNVSAWLLSDTGLTADVVKPTDPSNVTATACDGTAPNCSNIANKGYEIKLAWTASTDTGTGVTGYKIYRRAEANSTTPSDFTIVGYLDVNPPGAPVSTVYYDNDTNNDVTFTDTINEVPNTSMKGSATPRLNDYVDYYYRIVAIDAAGVQTEIVTLDSAPPYTPNNYNFAASKTKDVTSPSVPSSVVATPMGLDSSGLAQRVDLSWNASTDTRTQGRVPTGNGSGLSGYKVLQCQGDSTYCANDGNYSQIGTSASVSFTKEGLNEFTLYYYKLVAVDRASSSTITDAANNNSARSSSAGVTTASNTVPTVPASVTITTRTGDPNSDPLVGHQNTVSFLGSYAKNCASNVRCITGYEVYRSTTNYASSAQWLSNATKILDLSISPIGDERPITYTYVDNDASNNSTSPTVTRSAGGSVTVTKAQTAVLSDTTTYYYKIRTKDNTPANPDGGPFASGLSAIATGILHIGWDSTADDVAPNSPIEVKVKDIHGDGTTMLRNIITWQRLSDSDAQNLRSGTSDFKSYRVYRYTDAVNKSDLTLIVTKTTLGDNYHVDGIPQAQANLLYYYYVVAVDDADANYKYADGTVVNAYENISSYLTPVSINPAAAKPVVQNPQAVNISVSSATITWTTDQTTDSLVEYRVKNSSNVIAGGKDRTSPTLSHSVDLRALEKGTAYEYRIVSRNSLGNIDETASNTWREFSTLDFAIANASVTTTTTTATVSWATNIDADSNVEYKKEAKIGEAAAKSETAGDPTLTRNHEVVIKALKPDTNYTYKIRSVTGDKYIAETQFLTFKTKPYDTSQFTIAPNAANIAESNITATSARIVWNTQVATTSWVDYGTSSSSYTMSSGNDNFNTVHVVDLVNLTPGTTYYYKVKGTDENDIEYTSQEYSFTAILMPSISNVKVKDLGHYSATITWETNVSTDSVVKYGLDTSYNAQKGSTEMTKSHSLTLDNLTDNTIYHYKVAVRDQFANETSSSDLTFTTPLDTTGPEIKEVKIDILPMGTDDETAQAIISWTTNKPATTKIEYDEGVIGGTYSKKTTEDPTLNNSHTVIIKELNPSSTYHFKIVSKDKRGNITNSQDYTFVTPTKEKSILQLIIRSLEETFSWVKELPKFFRNIGQRITGR